MNFSKWRGRKQSDLDDEINSHIQMAEQERMDWGDTPQQAGQRARKQFGNVELVKEVARDAWGWITVEQFVQDARYGLRTLWKSPGFAVVAILTLALGIGANTAIFSVVNGVLLRPLPYAQPDQLVRISTNWTNGTDGGVSGPEYLDYRAQAKSFQDVAMHGSMFARMNISFGEGDPEQVAFSRVTHNFFGLLGVHAMLGRTFLFEEDVQGNNRVLVLSHGLWKRRFGGDTGVIGRNVDVQGISHRIVGVMPEGFNFPTKETEIWRPMGARFAELSRDARNLRCVARLKPGVSVEQAQAELDSIARGLQSEYPVNYPAASGFAPHIYSLLDYQVGRARTPLLVLLGAVGFVLLIACANVANLVLARANSRQRELAIRAALGAGQGRLLRQALSESVLLALLGGGLAVLLASFGLQALLAFSPGNIPRLSEATLSGAVLAFTLAISLLTGVLVGSAAALRVSKQNVNSALKAGGRGSSGGGQGIRNALVVSEVALAAMLLIGAGLLIRGFWKLQQVDPGFRPAGVLAGGVALLHVQYYDEARQVQFFEQLLAKLESQPNVESVGAIANEPFSGWLDDQSFIIEGRELAAPGLYPNEEVRIVTANYFRTIGIPVIAGREFERMDQAKSLPVAVISDSLARKYWPGESAIGKRLKLGTPESEGPWTTIVGIVGDVRHYGLNNQILPILYFPMPQVPTEGMTVMLRVKGDPAALTSAFRRAVREQDASLPIQHLRTMDAAIADSLAQPRFSFRMMWLFALLALALAAVGIYGVLAYSVSRRTNEIGIRIALGATRWKVMGMILDSGLRLIFSGLALGVLGGVAVSRVLSTLLFGLSPFDPVAYATVAAFLTAVGILAVCAPARRAMKVDPLVALRHE